MNECVVALFGGAIGWWLSMAWMSRRRGPVRRLARDLRTIWWFIFGGGYEDYRRFCQTVAEDDAVLREVARLRGEKQ